MDKEKKDKKIVGIFSFTCDEGCSIYLIEIFNTKLIEWLKAMELKYFLSMKDKVKIEGFDVVLVEGVISTEKDKAEIKKIRANAKTLIVMGTCAISGMPSGQRNQFNDEQLTRIQDDLKKFHFLPKALTVKEAVKVDDEIVGCPINREKFIEVFEKHLYAKA